MQIILPNIPMSIMPMSMLVLMYAVGFNIEEFPRELD